MPRYVSRAHRAADCEWWEGQRLEPVPEVDMHEPVRTGLLDQDGNEIWRMPRPIGFGRDDEW
ncbi:hypothetical protein [Novosphingobium pentaromativorans]|uniref:hypothetical protein n=1 Tax=Novosphingobium pentaromativorans TaxID=205844 RepID=UPI00051F83D3|nr:hypothetical protein [Novosphingobium pentaromativorans]AIT81231.1 hypothetical protein JI59_16305 [Novosphingobium pentaromativorans US6-1]